MPAAQHVAEIQERGFTLVPNVLEPRLIESLLAAIGGAGESIARRGRVYAQRNLLQLDLVRELTGSASLRAIVEPVLGTATIPVRALLFDKVPGANWHVGWHQDLIIPVRERRETPGFGPWTVKAGVPHVKPPIAVLEEMLTLRIALDDAGEANGPLRVIPGSHRFGELSPDQVRELAERESALTCCTMAGDVLAMRPLLLHASSPAATPAHRRVLHLEYAGCELPGELEWPATPQTIEPQ